MPGLPDSQDAGLVRSGYLTDALEVEKDRLGNALDGIRPLTAAS
jgi:hypothetical protein